MDFILKGLESLLGNIFSGGGGVFGRMGEGGGGIRRRKAQKGPVSHPFSLGGMQGHPIIGAPTGAPGGPSGNLLGDLFAGMEQRRAKPIGKKRVKTGGGGCSGGS